jgi:23S rRNA pseudouridine2605 synthase
MTEERVQKILARAGYGSRRECERVIDAGRVSVNGQRIKLGDRADMQKDHITVDGSPIKSTEEMVYIAIYKPRNVLSSTRTQNNLRTVVDLVPDGARLFPVGRLDLESEGLMLLTNDGDLANRLTHPRYGHEKEYRVLVARHPDQTQLQTWRRGVVLPDGYRTAPAQVRFDRAQGEGAWLRVVLTEGRKRQIRETAGQLGLPVVKLIRVRIGMLQVGRLKAGQWRHLEADEVRELKGEKPKHKASHSKRNKHVP